MRQDIDGAEILSVSNEMADAACAAILPFFRSNSLQAENKLQDGFDPVTVADRAAEEAMRKVLKARRPQDAILGEEYGSHQPSENQTCHDQLNSNTEQFLSKTK